jgi:uncharacterized protein YaaQ
MKLIIAIVQDYDADQVLRVTTSNGFRVTRIASIGGFLRSTNTTLLYGVDDANAPHCLAIIQSVCGTRVHTIDTETEESWIEMGGGEIARDAAGGAVVLILNVERFEQLQPAGRDDDRPAPDP